MIVIVLSSLLTAGAAGCTVNTYNCNVKDACPTNAGTTAGAAH